MKFFEDCRPSKPSSLLTLIKVAVSLIMVAYTLYMVIANFALVKQVAQNVRRGCIFNYWELLSLFRADELVFADESAVVSSVLK